ncbi:MAG: TonB-dependent receptor [Gammaproteobacteria bacterium]
MHLVSVVLLTILIFMNTALFAEEQLKPIEVQSTVLHAQSVDVITDKELDRKLSNSIGETLENELGVSSTYFGPGASRPIIRGLGSNRVRVLENGIDSLDASSASEDHAVTIDPYTADQIEIIRGPATLRYGPGAIGGVVNVTNQRIPTRNDIEPLEVKATVEHATVSDGNTAAIELKGSKNSFNWHLDGLTRETNDYDIDGFANDDEPEDRGRLGNSDIETDQYGIGGSYLTEYFLAGLSFSRFDTEYGIPGAEEGDVRIDLKQYRYDSLLEFYNLSEFIESVSLRSTYNNYRHFEILEGDIETTFENEELESRLEIVNKVNEQWDNIFGFQYNDREFSAAGEEAFIQPVDEKRYGIFGISHYHTDIWDFEGGLRFDRNEFKPDNDQDEEFDVLSVSLGATRFFDNNLELNVFAGRSERAPQETALYAEGPHLATLTFETGSTDIDKETSYNLEVGLSQQGKRTGWKVNAYYNQIDDFIYLASADANNDGIADRADEEGMFELDGELLVVNYDNEDVTFYGIEAELTHQLIETNSYTLDGRVFGDYVRAEFDDNDLGDVPRITPARIGAGAVFTYDTWQTAVDVIVTSDSSNEADLETDTDSFTMLNASINKTVYAGDSDLNLYVKAENLLDEDARQHTSFQKDRAVLPGRNIIFGLSIDY